MLNRNQTHLHLLEEEEQSELIERILVHLAGAKASVQRMVGESELRRSGIDSFSDELQAELRAGLGEEAYQEIRDAGTLREDVREQVHRIVGTVMVAEAYW